MLETLTIEQKNAIKKIVKMHMLVSFLIMIRYTALILLSTFVTVALNVFYVKSQSFVFPMTIVNMLFLMHFMLQETAAQREKLNAAVKKVLHPDQEVK